MAKRTWSVAGLLVAGALLGACSKQADTNANAPASPATGSTAEVVRPAVPDSPAGGPTGIAGSAPHTGSSGGDAVTGTTGNAATGSTAQAGAPGTGLNGGLGGGSVMGAAPATGTSGAVPGGSTNTTSSDAVGRR